jgi:DNA segregation ATPase FtsK/SpoIIIE-like protein
MAYTIPVIIIGGCWFAWRHQENDEYIDYFAVSLRLIGALALILTSCGLAAINADDIWYFASGGVIGSLLSTTLQPLLHSSGGTIALLCIWAAGLTLFTGWSWVSIAEKLGGAILSFSPLPATVPVGTIPGSMKANTKTMKKSTTTSRQAAGISSCAYFAQRAGAP